MQRRKIVAAAAILAALTAGLGTAVSHAAGNTPSNTPGNAPGGGDVQPQIIGGHEATGNTDWMVSVQYDAPTHDRYDWHTCGGTLAVARDLVITNAHCVTDPPAQAGDTATLASDWHLDTTTLTIPTTEKVFKVRVGSKDWADGGQLVAVKSITVHPGWNWAIGAPQAEVDDLAVLRLDHPVDYQQMQLANSPARRGDHVVVYGWGIDHPDSTTGPLPRRLQQLESRVLGRNQCRDVAISAKEICINNPNGTDGVCFGDSGGPAVRYTTTGVPQLVGGVSRSAGAYCGIAPTAFTSQPHFRTWIYQIARSSAPPIGTTEPAKAE